MSQFYQNTVSESESNHPKNSLKMLGLEMNVRTDQYLTSKNYGKKSYLSFVEAFEHKTLPIVAFQYHPKSLGLC